MMISHAEIKDGLRVHRRNEVDEPDGFDDENIRISGRTMSSVALLKKSAEYLGT